MVKLELRKQKRLVQVLLVNTARHGLPHVRGQDEILYVNELIITIPLGTTTKDENRAA